MLFSVIIPTYNRRDLLRQALASVRAQRFADYEVIVVDDGSDDGTAEALAAEGEWLRVLVQPNRGPGPARNLGAEAARGDYLTFLDSDDLWFPWTLETYARAVAAHGSPGVIIGRNVYFGDGEAPGVDEGRCLTSAHRRLFDAMRTGEVKIPTPSCAIRRDRFEAVGGFGEAPTAEDVDLWLRAGCVPGYVHVASPVLSAQRRHRESVSRDLPKMIEGLSFLIAQELSGRYPGGPALRPVREARIAMASRSLAVACLDAGRIGMGVRAYLRSFAMNLRRLRFRFLLGYPALAIAALLQGAFHRAPRTGR